MDNSKIKIPIFIIVHDRITVLKKTIESLEQIKTIPIEIIFHNVASTFPPCLEFLEQMKQKGHTIYNTTKNHYKTIVYSVNKYLADHPECEYYIITDPDIELDNVNPDILDFYLFLMKKYDNKLVIGPMLRIDDIPDYYPKKSHAIKTHKAQFWHKKPVDIKWNDNTYQIQRAFIDSTFQLVHRSNKKDLPRPGIRCYAPYAARHLDWYIDPNNMNDDQIYYSKKSNSNAHWGKLKILQPLKK